MGQQGGTFAAADERRGAAAALEMAVNRLKTLEWRIGFIRRGVREPEGYVDSVNMMEHISITSSSSPLQAKPHLIFCRFDQGTSPLVNRALLAARSPPGSHGAETSKRGGG